MKNNKIKDYINKNFNFNKNTKILVGFSGGRDSVCLLHALYELSKENSFFIKALHVNHNIRNEEAKRDEKFCEEFCASRNIDFILYDIDVKKIAKDKKLSLEEAARICRYDALKKEANDNNMIIAIAQHKNDRVETVINNILRGTGIKGLIGIKEERFDVIRPLVSFIRDEIDEYIKDNNLDFVEDSTNNDINITRNFIRNVIFKDFSKVNTNFIEHIYNLSKEAEEIDKYIVDLSNFCYNNVLIEENDDNIIIDNKKFKTLSHFVKIEIIKNIFEKLVNTKKDISLVHLESVINISNIEKGAHIDLPYNITMDKKQNKLIFNKNNINISMSKKRKKV